jgi:hypothetical protein
MPFDLKTVTEIGTFLVAYDFLHGLMTVVMTSGRIILTVPAGMKIRMTDRTL